MKMRDVEVKEEEGEREFSVKKMKKERKELCGFGSSKGSIHRRRCIRFQWSWNGSGAMKTIQLDLVFSSHHEGFGSSIFCFLHIRF